MMKEGKETASSSSSSSYNKEEDIETEAIMIGPYQPPKANAISPGILTRPSNEIGFPYRMKCPYCSSCEEGNGDDKMITVVTNDVDVFRIALILSIVAFVAWLNTKDDGLSFFLFYAFLWIIWLPVSAANIFLVPW
jgi:hypothetical protein